MSDPDGNYDFSPSILQVHSTRRYPHYKDQVSETTMATPPPPETMSSPGLDRTPVLSNNYSNSQSSTQTANKGQIQTGAGIINQDRNPTAVVTAVAIPSEYPTTSSGPSNTPLSYSDRQSDPANLSSIPTTDEESGYPPSSERMQRGNKKVWIFGILGICAIAVIAAAVVSVVIVLGSPSSSSKQEAQSSLHPTINPPTPTIPPITTPPTTIPPTTVPPTTTIPTSPPTESRQEKIVAYIDSIKQSTGEITYSPSEIPTTPENRAVKWLIDQDPLELLPNTADDQFRLRQRYALLTLWFQEETPKWTNDGGWLMSEDECSWFGVTCIQGYLDEYWKVQNIVTSLNIGDWKVGNNLFGKIPVDLALLNSTTALDLQSNALTGTIPESIWGMTKLTFLDLANTTIHGTISPLIVQLKDLQVLDLQSTFLTGTIPDTLWNLSKLTILNLFDVKVQGTLPSFIGIMMSDLVVLDLYQNSFVGTIPDSLWYLTKLTWLQTGIWEDAKPFPSLIGKLEDLSHLLLYETGLSGNIPEELWSLSKLTFLSMWKLGLSAHPLSESVSNLTDIQTLYLQEISLTGSLPESIGTLTNLQEFSVYSNALTGTLPVDIGFWTDLTGFYITNNQLSGSIPQSIANWTKLEKAYFGGNLLTGSIPSQLCAISPKPTIEIDCLKISCDCCTCFPSRRNAV